MRGVDFNQQLVPADVRAEHHELGVRRQMFAQIGGDKAGRGGVAQIDLQQGSTPRVRRGADAAGLAQARVVAQDLIQLRR